MTVIDLDYLTIFVATVLYFLLGWFWYSPLLFQKAWRRHMQMPEKTGSMLAPSIFAFLSYYLQAFVLCLLMGIAGVASTLDGIVFSLMIWVGFVFPFQLSPILWTKKPWQAFLIDGSYGFIAYVLLGAILGS